MARHDVSRNRHQVRLELHQRPDGIRQRLRPEEYSGMDIREQQHPEWIEPGRPAAGRDRGLGQYEAPLEQPAVRVPDSAQTGVQEARHDDVEVPLDDLDQPFVRVDPATLPAGHDTRGTEPPPPLDRPHATSIAVSGSVASSVWYLMAMSDRLLDASPGTHARATVHARAAVHVTTFSVILSLSFCHLLNDMMQSLLPALLIGMGSSIFHPEASRVARMAAGGRYGLAQSLFQVGGNIGSASGPLLAAFVVVPHGPSSIAWFSAAKAASSGPEAEPIFPPTW